MSMGHHFSNQDMYLCKVACSQMMVNRNAQMHWSKEFSTSAVFQNLGKRCF